MDLTDVARKRHVAERGLDEVRPLHYIKVVNGLSKVVDVGQLYQSARRCRVFFRHLSLDATMMSIPEMLLPVGNDRNRIDLLVGCLLISSYRSKLRDLIDGSPSS